MLKAGKSFRTEFRAEKVSPAVYPRHRNRGELPMTWLKSREIIALMYP
jgi:hypothetical protein